MKKKKMMLTGSLAAVFALWTAAVSVIDVRPIGPLESRVGFAALNQFVHGLTGVHMPLYVLTDWLGLVPFGVAAAFAVLGLVQWVSRKKLAAVDRSLFVLGGFYLLVMAVYLAFEIFVVNFRPVLINGVPEASYPSSTTMLTLCVMPTAVLQLNGRVRNAALRRTLSAAMTAFAVFMVAARLVSGVHWVTDIVGGVLLSAALVMLYQVFDE